MKKVAIFVEGMTEQKFVVKFLSEWFNSFGIHVELGQQLRGNIVIQTVPAPSKTLSAYVMVVNCANDEQVMTQIRDQYHTLKSGGYSAVIGLRDVYPRTHAEIGLLRKGLIGALPKGALKAQIHLAEMEVEAWFIAESTHFARINPKLTVKRIGTGGFNLGVKCESWAHPAETLHQIYQLEGLAYKKTAKHVERTITALSLTELATNVIPVVPALSKFIDALEAAVS